MIFRRFSKSLSITYYITIRSHQVDLIISSDQSKIRALVDWSLYSVRVSSCDRTSFDSSGQEFFCSFLLERSSTRSNNPRLVTVYHLFGDSCKSIDISCDIRAIKNSFFILSSFLNLSFSFCLFFTFSFFRVLSFCNN